MATLQAMFSDPWTRETLDAVLRHQKGHMENTVDFILRHTGKDPNELVQKLKAGINPDDSIVQLDAELARQLSQGAQIGSTAMGEGGVTAAATAPRRGRGTPVTLPDDFLRVPGYGSSSQSQLERDEALARMLQNEMFAGQLAGTPDLAHLARTTTARGHGTAAAVRRGPPSERSSSAGTEPNRPVFPGLPQNPAQVMKSLSELGDNAKKRLQMLAANFNQRNTSNGAGTMTTSDSVPASERRGLLDDDQEEGYEFASR